MFDRDQEQVNIFDYSQKKEQSDFDVNLHDKRVQAISNKLYQSSIKNTSKSFTIERDLNLTKFQMSAFNTGLTMSQTQSRPSSAQRFVDKRTINRWKRASFSPNQTNQSIESFPQRPRSANLYSSTYGVQNQRREFSQNLKQMAMRIQQGENFANE